jgi:putative FmdB family regulatory protein
MPIYEYACKKCGEFEVTQRITDRPLTRCPTCRGKVTKLISSTSFQLKGSGWYVTDYARKDSGTEGKGSDAKEGSADGGASETAASKTDTASKSTDTTTKKKDTSSGTKATAQAAA